ncbi:ArsR family transcriptional regulator [Leptospira gomenensis]|uniref:ArsR family transcriptional regulator n=1 Tax=Leptospira gomenensis TaxID=2484974 RepID=A0A5F1YKG1_9LEPT|nr:metalloregulator ArsR/SmtB family transcription factor [Leptospira gomenensis]TGK34349.1 ArsR family transcriptional regulator [Leptospira gomenensis]TGK37290.1 ArsR family transcriptional regulator [Leptospira gomenensis]TGK50977.1 ArsR family transcriptional regulator [Leptospira gomenensis]TGK56599.1 ArsR family transcriptional regulator [Leptospira gomenensis]
MDRQKSGRQFKDFIYVALSKYGKAISDPKRIELLDLLLQAEKNVDLLSKEIGMSVASTSHHLQILKDARLVGDRKDGRNIFYRIEAVGTAIFGVVAESGREFNAEIKVVMDSFFGDECELKELEYSDFIKRISLKEVVLVDVRPSDEYAAGHFPGAISVPLKELESKLASFPKRKKIVAYCRGKYCVLSKEAVEILRSHGLNAYRISHGPLEFANAGFEFVK